MATFEPNVTDVFPEPSLFTPDFSFMDKMLQRRQQMYNQGFSQLNNKYNAINKDVTNPLNREARDKFLKQAVENLKGLSSMDLSQLQNVEAAGNVFAPFTKNTNIVGDQVLTEHWDNQEKIAESFRMKDGGKEYSDDNINYVRLQKMNFAQDSPDAWKSYYTGKRSFTPYYDWNKEYKEAMKDFKPSRTKIEKLNGMYTVTTEDKSYTQDEISRYLNATLSDKAKSQMKIEAAVRLGSNPQALGQAYMETASQELPVIDKRINEIDVNLKKERDPAKIIKLKEDKQYYEDQKDELSGQVKNIQKGDLSYIKSNADALAFRLYYGNTVKKIANGYSHTDIDQTIGYDQVAMMYYKEAREDARAKYKADREAEKDNKIYDPLSINIQAEHEITSLSKIDEDVKEANNVLLGKKEELKNYIFSTQDKSKGLQYKTTKDISETDIQNFIQRNRNDNKVREFISAGEKLTERKSRKDVWKDNADAYARKTMGAEYDEMKTLEKQGIGTKGLDEFEARVKQQHPNPNDAYYQKYMGTSQYERERETAKAFGTLGNPVPTRLKSLQQSYNKFVRDFNAKPETDISRSVSGFVLSEEDKRLKNIKGYLSQITGAGAEKVGQVAMVPGLDKYDIIFNIKDIAGKESSVDRATLLNNLTANFTNLGKGIKVEYNENLDRYTIKNLGYTIAPALNPYAFIPPVHAEMLNTLENYGGSLNQSRTTPFFSMSGKAGMHSFQVQKDFGVSAESNSYILLVDNKPFRHSFPSSVAAYEAANVLINDPTAVNIVLAGGR